MTESEQSVDRSFDYFGESFQRSDSIDPFAETEFAEALDDETDAGSLHGVAVMWRLALSCVAEEDRARFRAVSRKNKADAMAFMKVYREWTADATERPTGLPTDSSDGPALTVVSSESLPEPAATPKRAPRPDMALAISRSA